MPARQLPLVIALLLALLAGCAEEPELSPAARTAENAWQALRKDHNEASYLMFINSNRMAAREHGHPHDAAGIRFQLRALEAQADECVRAQDEHIAIDVQMRVDELIDGEFLDVYEEELPGSRKRFEAARAKATAYLGE